MCPSTAGRLCSPDSRLALGSTSRTSSKRPSPVLLCGRRTVCEPKSERNPGRSSRLNRTSCEEWHCAQPFDSGVNAPPPCHSGCSPTTVTATTPHPEATRPSTAPTTGDRSLLPIGRCGISDPAVAHSGRSVLRSQPGRRRRDIQFQPAFGQAVMAAGARRPSESGHRPSHLSGCRPTIAP